MPTTWLKVKDWVAVQKALQLQQLQWLQSEREEKGDDRWLRRLSRQESWPQSLRHVIVCDNDHHMERKRDWRLQLVKEKGPVRLQNLARDYDYNFAGTKVQTTKENYNVDWRSHPTTDWLQTFFSHGSRAGQTTKTVASSGNGGNYNSSGSTTAENPTTLAAAIDFTTTATTIPSALYEHYEHTTSLFTSDATTSDTVTSDTVDLTNPLPGVCSHYLCMLRLPQARLPQPTVFDRTTLLPRMGTRDMELP